MLVRRRRDRQEYRCFAALPSADRVLAFRGMAVAVAGALPSGTREPPGVPRREVRFRDVSFAYPGGEPCSSTST